MAKPYGGDAPLSYNKYLRVPELLRLQTRLGPPDAHDEMLFIIVQQAQELWFKQVLFELRTIIAVLARPTVKRTPVATTSRFEKSGASLRIVPRSLFRS